MKIISADGLGVSALLAAAEKLYELTEERNIALGVIGAGSVGNDEPLALAVATTLGPGRPRLGVSIERNPKIINLDDDTPVFEADVEALCEAHSEPVSEHECHG